jgi:hypothetical protein
MVVSASNYWFCGIRITNKYILLLLLQMLQIINSVHASTDSLQRRGMTLNLATTVKVAVDSEGDATELTHVSLVNPRKTRPSSKQLAVGKR